MILRKQIDRCLHFSEVGDKTSWCRRERDRVVKTRVGRGSRESEYRSEQRERGTSERRERVLLILSDLVVWINLKTKDFNQFI